VVVDEDVARVPGMERVSGELKESIRERRWSVLHSNLVGPISCSPSPSGFSEGKLRRPHGEHLDNIVRLDSDERVRDTYLTSAAVGCRRVQKLHVHSCLPGWRVNEVDAGEAGSVRQTRLGSTALEHVFPCSVKRKPQPSVQGTVERVSFSGNRLVSVWMLGAKQFTSNSDTETAEAGCDYYHHPLICKGILQCGLFGIVRPISI